MPGMQGWGVPGMQGRYPRPQSREGFFGPRYGTHLGHPSSDDHAVPRPRRLGPLTRGSGEGGWHSAAQSQPPPTMGEALPSLHPLIRARGLSHAL